MNFMYFEVKEPSRAVTSLFNSIVAPRPIGWISSISAAGEVNLAPFSYFNGISPAPAMVMFTCNQPSDRAEKDTLANVREVPQFVANYAAWDLRESVVATSATVPRGSNEFELANLEASPSRLVRPPRVTASPAQLECEVVRIVDIPPRGPGEVMSSIVIGRVLAFHIQDIYLDKDGRFDVVKARPLTRLGGFNYTSIGQIAQIPRPSNSVMHSAHD